MRSVDQNLSRQPGGVLPGSQHIQEAEGHQRHLKTHEDFPLPVAPMMAFRPGFMSPLADGRKTS
ncbi:hypothetical protein EYF80_065603 [Liparis tanakae]|uniref:Uncharacterized protein n=1 Tax=Liparis tanakae TaxID=230148 RepID=A0A4Z2E6Q9_9TELE|nr:hypothetical protein EYF80_065603 [Liparis tanakae]